MKRILVYGIGNPYRCDDAVGIRVAEQLANKIRKSNIDVKWGSIDGVAILDEVVGYDRVIFIDSVKTEKGNPGNIYKINPNSFSSAHSFSSHGINFVTALEFGKKFDLKMPEQTNIYAIEIEDNETFSEECTPKVTAAISKLVERILKDLDASEDS
ncbi:MAG: hydrogenase maturation protease [bacterium]